MGLVSLKISSFLPTFFPKKIEAWQKERDQYFAQKISYVLELFIATVHHYLATLYLHPERSYVQEAPVYNEMRVDLYNFSIHQFPQLKALQDFP